MASRRLLWRALQNIGLHRQWYLLCAWATWAIYRLVVDSRPWYYNTAPTYNPRQTCYCHLLLLLTHYTLATTLHRKLTFVPRLNNILIISLVWQANDDKNWRWLQNVARIQRWRGERVGAVVSAFANNDLTKTGSIPSKTAVAYSAWSRLKSLA